MFKDDFTEAAVGELRRNGCVTFNWFADDHWRFETFSNRWAPHFSWAITTDAAAVKKSADLGITHVIRSQWAVNHHLYRPLDRPRRFSVTFLGQPHRDRRRLIDALRRAGIPVQAWGYGWPGGKLSTRRAVEVINESEVNLNLPNASVGRTDQIKGRDFEVPACRGLLVTKRVDTLSDYYEIGQEILTYEDFDDLERQIRWALTHPGDVDRIRDAGYRRMLRDHTYERRFTEIFREAGLFR
jgi:spore maturation protein CgeB